MSVLYRGGMTNTVSTMGDVDLSIRMILEHGAGVFGDASVVSFTGDGTTRASFAEIGRRSAQLANALHHLGVRPGDVVATLQFNTQAH